MEIEIKNLEKIENASRTCFYKINNENHNIYLFSFCVLQSSILIHVMAVFAGYKR